MRGRAVRERVGVTLDLLNMCAINPGRSYQAGRSGSSKEEMTWRVATHCCRLMIFSNMSDMIPRRCDERTTTIRFTMPQSRELFPLKTKVSCVLLLRVAALWSSIRSLSLYSLLRTPLGCGKSHLTIVIAVSSWASSVAGCVHRRIMLTIWAQALKSDVGFPAFSRISHHPILSCSLGLLQESTSGESSNLFQMVSLFKTYSFNMLIPVVTRTISFGFAGFAKISWLLTCESH